MIAGGGGETMFDRVTYKLLIKLYRNGKLTEKEVNAITYQPERGCGNNHILFLMGNHLIDSNLVGEKMDRNFNTIEEGVMVFEINLKGRAFVEQKRRDFGGFLIPYTITTFIALLSLVGVIASNWETILSWFQ